MLKIEGILKKFAQQYQVEKGFLSQKSQVHRQGAIDLCMHVLPRQLSVKRHKKLVYIVRGNRVIVIVLEMIGVCVYIRNTNCNSKDIFVEVGIKNLSLLRVCMRAKKQGTHDSC